MKHAGVLFAGHGQVNFPPGHNREEILHQLSVFQIPIYMNDRIPFTRPDRL